MDEEEVPPEDDTSAAPAIAALLAALLVLRDGSGEEGVGTQTAEELVKGLTKKIVASLGGVLLMIAQRALARHLSTVPSEVAQAIRKAKADSAATAAAVQEAEDVLELAFKSLLLNGEKGQIPKNWEKRQALRASRLINNTVMIRAAEQLPALPAPEKEVEKEAEKEAKIDWRKKWHNRQDSRVRTTHVFLGADGAPYNEVPLDGVFISIRGARLKYPGDPTAPISEVAGCRCWMTVVPRLG